MARAAHHEITLPWRDTVDGAVAEFGAIFRVEIVGGKWQCSAKSGRCRTVIAKELSSQNEAKRRAEAHAATMPEVRAVAKSRAADAKPGAKKTASRRSTRSNAKSDERDTHASARASRSSRKSEPAPEVVQPPAPSVEAREPDLTAEPSAPSPSMTTLGVTYQTTGDGCLCGKTQGVCWVANGKEVVFARPPPQDVHDRVRDAVMQHYAAEDAARETAERAEREASERATRKEAAAQARASKAAAKKAAVRKITKQSKPAKKVAAARNSRAQAKPAKDTEPARETKPAKGIRAKTAKDAAEVKPAKGRKAGHARSSKPKPARGKRSATKEDAPVTTTPDETKPAAAKRQSEEAAAPAAPPGPIAWSDVEGKPRGVAAHGTFLIEPEGQGFALYFADPGGQSRHLRSGTMPELRRAAEEYAARGEPAPLRDAPSREQDEALMRIFASGAVEGA